MSRVSEWNEFRHQKQSPPNPLQFNFQVSTMEGFFKVAFLALPPATNPVREAD